MTSGDHSRKEPGDPDQVKMYYVYVIIDIITAREELST